MHKEAVELDTFTVELYKHQQTWPRYLIARCRKSQSSDSLVTEEYNQLTLHFTAITGF